MEKLWMIVACILAWVTVASGLWCYKCSGNERNRGECTQNMVECDAFQDACTTYIRWGVTPDWTPRGDRKYYIFKDCDTRNGCDRRRNAISSHCNRDWYNDWACIDCCTGDLCNYYVTLGSGTVRGSILAVAGSLLGYFTLQRVL